MSVPTRNPWEMRKAEWDAMLDQIVAAGEEGARDIPYSSTLKLEQRLKMERGKLAKLQTQYFNTQLPSVPLVKKFRDQTEKVRQLRLEIETKDSNNRRHFQAKGLGMQDAAKKNYGHLVSSGAIQLREGPDFFVTVANHKGIVKEALLNGWAIPSEVLEDYPDLTAIYTEVNHEYTTGNNPAQ